MKGSLAGKVAVVTGGTGGIGTATVKALRSAGAVAVVWDVAAAVSVSAVRRSAAGHVHWFDRVDVTDPAAVADAASRLFRRTRRVDILINNAGINIDEGDSLQTRDEVWRKTIDTNLAGALHCTHALVPYEAAQVGPHHQHRLRVGSPGYPGMVSYVASKAALIGITKVWAQEFGPHGITANLVSPGYIRTGMNALVPVDMVEAITARCPVRRIGEPEDVAALHVFLASERAGFITGADIPVDGGFVP